MLGVLIFFALGIGLGSLLKPGKGKLKLTGRISMYAVYLLLFILGVSVGANPEILSTIDTLGLKAFVISGLSLAGTLFATWIYTQFIQKLKKSKLQE